MPKTGLGFQLSTDCKNLCGGRIGRHGRPFDIPRLRSGSKTGGILSIFSILRSKLHHRSYCQNLVKIFEVLGLEKWSDEVVCIGVIGMALAAVVALVIPKLKRQKDLVSKLTNDFGFHREKKGARQRYLDITGRDLQTIYIQMIQLKSLWVLILSIAIRKLAASMIKTCLPGYLRNRYPDVEEMDDKDGLIFGATGSISISVGDITALTIWRTTTAWKWKLIPFWIAVIGGVTSSILLISAMFSTDDRSEYTDVRVLYGNLTLALFTSYIWLDILFTIVISLLNLRCGSMAVSRRWSRITASGPQQ